MRRKIAVLILIIGVCVMGLAGFRISEAEKVYREGNAAYEDLSDRVKGGADNGSASGPGSQIHIPALNIDFEALKAINEDSVAWLYCPDSEIDYPVMKADDYSYYLSHLPDGTVNANGSLFLDFNSASDFSGRLSVIYGHHMKTGKMFGGLKEYKDQGYYNRHPYMYLYTDHGNYRIKLVYGFVIGSGQWMSRAFMYEENLDALIAYAEHNTTFKSNARHEKGDRIIALSTCSYEFEGARYVVLGVLES